MEEGFADVAQRFSAIEARLERLYGIPREASASITKPLLQGSEEKQDEDESQDMTISGGVARAQSIRQDSSVDVDMIFEFPNPHRIANLKHDASDEACANLKFADGMTDAELEKRKSKAKMLRQKAYEEENNKLNADEQFFKDNVKNLVQRHKTKDQIARRRMPADSNDFLQDYGEDPQYAAGGESRQLQAVFRGFLMEKRDRDAFKVPEDMNAMNPLNNYNITSARLAAMSLVIDFLHAEHEKYEVFYFSRTDHSKLYLCVRMRDEAAAEHAVQSNANVQLQFDKLSRIGVNVAPRKDGSPLPLFATYSDYLNAKGLYVPHFDEADKKIPDKDKPFKDRGTWLDALKRPFMSGGVVEDDAARSKTRKHLTKGSAFRKVDRIRLLYDKITDTIDIDAMTQWRLLDRYYPAHSLARLKWHRHNYGAILEGFKLWTFSPPLDDIEHYFGAHIAMYFVFSSELLFSLCSLIGATILITLFVAVYEFHDKPGDGIASAFSAAFWDFVWGRKYPCARSVLAATTVLWTHYLHYRISHRAQIKMIDWGQHKSLDHSDIKSYLNPGFRGYLMPSEVDETVLDLDVPYEKKGTGRRKAFWFTGGFAVMSIMIIVSIYLAAAQIDKHGSTLGFTLAGFAVTAALKVLQYLWKAKWAEEIVQMEYHRYELSYLTSWANKMVVIHSISSFTAFFYVGFIMAHVDKCPTSHTDCFGYLCYQMTSIFSSFIACACVEAILPPMKIAFDRQQKREAAKALGKSEYKLSDVSFLEYEGNLDNYSTTDQAEDYCQHLIPLAFVLLFGITMPFGCMLALIVSLLQLHVDAYNLTHTMQRPFPAQTLGLTSWLEILEGFSLLAIYTNAALVCFDLAPIADKPLRVQLLAFFATSTVGIIVHMTIRYLMPTINADRVMEKLRQERVWHVADQVTDHLRNTFVDEKELKKKERHNRKAGAEPDLSDLLQKAEKAELATQLAVRADGKFSNGKGRPLKNITEITRLHPGEDYFESAEHVEEAEYMEKITRTVTESSASMGEKLGIFG